MAAGCVAICTGRALQLQLMAHGVCQGGSGAAPWHIAAPGKLQRLLHASLPSNRLTSSLSSLQPEKVIEAVHKICGVRAGV